MGEMAQRILNAMKKQNVSYGELSVLTGIPKSALQRYATGETEKVPLNRVEMIAQALHVEASWLLGWDSEEETKSSRLRSLSRLQDNEITPEQDKEIANFIDYLLSQRGKEQE